ncbi:MAG: nicotinate-nucleotide adenylyltransferase, partial [Coriobacteriaceae bacterium]|nr:nicotinate-nucleotide adenylyltransferase [Coriobacteriaceae bacterium]
MSDRLGIMGGTFDPVHDAHLEVARAVADARGLARGVFIPTGNPHFKLDPHVTPALPRARVVALA